MSTRLMERVHTTVRIAHDLSDALKEPSDYVRMVSDHAIQLFNKGSQKDPHARIDTATERAKRYYASPESTLSTGKRIAPHQVRLGIIRAQDILRCAYRVARGGCDFAAALCTLRQAAAKRRAVHLNERWNRAHTPARPRSLPTLS